MYREKYLKYKTKYLELKKLTGGTPELNAECEKQIEEHGIHGECDKCKYVHDSMVENAETKTTQSVCEIPTGMMKVDGLSKADPKENILYFNHPENPENRYKILKYDLEKKYFITEASRTMLMDYKLYKSIKSYLPTEKPKIKLYPDDINTFCAEGNIVWVTKNSKVGSGGIDSCMFVIIILNDNTKICIHHNVYDNLEDFSSLEELGGKYYKNMSNYTILREIFANSCIDKRIVNKIYLCFNNKNDHYDYNNLIDMYCSLSSEKYKLVNYKRYLVDNNNDVYGLKMYRCDWV